MPELLWKPDEEKIKNSNMYRFMEFVNEKLNHDFRDYNALYQWSIQDIPGFLV